MQREVWHDQKNKLRQQSWQSRWISKIKVKFVKDKAKDNSWDTRWREAGLDFNSQWETKCCISEQVRRILQDLELPWVWPEKNRQWVEKAEFTGLNKRWCWYSAQLSEKEVRERPLGVRIKRPGLATLSLSCWLNMQGEGWRDRSRLEERTELASLGSAQ